MSFIELGERFTDSAPSAGNAALSLMWMPLLAGSHHFRRRVG